VITNPGIQPFNADHTIDPTARRLRQMLAALAVRLKAKADPETQGTFERIDMPLSLERLRQQLWAVAEDSVEQSLVASIREEGWRALAEGGLEAMRALADRACDDDHLLSILDHRWDGIGTNRRGHRVC
jgi:hypothetical protein